MLIRKGIIEVYEGYADKSELLESIDTLRDGTYGYLIFDKNKNRSLPQLRFLFGYLLKTLSEELPEHPSPETLYRYFEELYAPIHRCNIPGESKVFEYFDLKNEPTTEVERVIDAIIHHAKKEWNIELKTRDQLKTAEAAELYVGAYAETWKNFIKKSNNTTHDGTRKNTYGI